MRRIASPLSALLLVTGGLVAAGCSNSESDPTAEAAVAAGPIVATTTIWGDVVSNLACDGSVEVSTLVPAGGDPHSFEPSLADRAKLDAASLVVVNGLGLEERLEDTIDAVREDGVPVFALADNISPGVLEGSEHSDEEGHADGKDHSDGEDEHAHDGGDPHIWFDPTRVSSALPTLADALVEDAGLDRDAVQACLSDYQAELQRVHEDVEQALTSVPESRRALVTNHDALAYLADRYGYEVVGTVIPSQSSLAQTNPAQLERLVETIEANGVGAIFAESQSSAADAAAVGREAGGVEVISLFTGTLGDRDSGADTYAGFMRTNATLIAEGLGRDG